MPHQTGAHCGGIRTIEDIRARCRVDDISGCWRWAGAISHNGTKANSRVPVAWYQPEQRVVSVLRLAVQLARGKPLSRSWVVWRTCCDALCCNPRHLKAGTRAQLGEWTAQQGHQRGDPKRAAINRRIKIDSGQATLTPELAGWVRESDQRGVDLAHALGVSATSISRVRLRRTWAPVVAAASVFAWRPPANDRAAQEAA